MHLLVAWAGADAGSVRALLAKDRLPILARRFAAAGDLPALNSPDATPFALAVSLATGMSPADHGLLAPVQPSPDGSAWRPAQAANWPAAPVWNRLADAGVSTAAVGWPGTHGAAPRSLLALASDLDLSAVDSALRPLDPLPGGRDRVALVRVAPGDLDPGLLGFFIPRAELPANPSADPVVRELMRQLARIYSAHNTAVALLQSDEPPALLAVHYELPLLQASALRRHPRLREAALRILDLLLDDLLSHASEATLWLAGLAPAACFLVAPDRAATPELTGVAPALLAAFGLPPGVAPPSPAPHRVDEAALLHRYHAVGLAADVCLKGPPSRAARRQYQAALGRLLLAEQRPGEALPLLAPVHFHHPEDLTSALSLYECLHQLGLRDEAREPAAALREHAPAGPRSRLIEAGLVLRHLRQPARALPLLASLLDDPRLGAQAASLYREALLHLRRFAEARPLLEAAIANGSATADTHAGLAYAWFHLGELIPAETAARAALALGSTRPQPARILEHLAARRAGRRAPEAAVPDWEELLADASLREEQRAAYARLRADFLAARSHFRAGQTPQAFLAGTPAPPADARWTLVTGAPRSGMALLLRMLAFGGYPVLTDGIRAPDPHNPCGYFEWQPAARLAARPRLIDEAANHAVKLPLPALDRLPRDRRYRVLFVTRDPDEIVRSQAALLGLLPAPAAAIAELADHLARRLESIRVDPNFDLLEVPYDDLRTQPAVWAERLADFLGRDLLRRPAAMPAAVRPDLPRHRRP